MKRPAFAISLLSLFSILFSLFSLSAHAAINVPTNFLTLNTGLIGWWTFDGKDVNWATNMAVDKSSSAENAQLIGLSTTTSTVIGKIGQALNFVRPNQSRAYIPFGSASALNTGAGSVTLSVWVKLTSLPTSSHYYGFVSGGDGGTGAGTYFLGIDKDVFVAGANLDMNFTDSSFSGNQALSYPIALTIGTWYQFASVYNVANNAETLYVNGAQVAQRTASLPPFVNTNFDFGVGYDQSCNCGLGDSFTDGVIDDARVYNRALSTTEVKQLYNSTNGAHVNVSPAGPNNLGLNKGLVGWWTFDGNTMKENVADSSGQGNNGGLVSFTSTTTVAGKIGQGLRFDGTSNYVDMGQVLNLVSPRQGLTLSAWVKPDALNSGFNSVIDNLLNAGSYRFGVSSGGVVFFGIRDAANGYEQVNSNNFVVSVGTWTHIVATFDDNTTARVYINGQLDSTKTDFTLTRAATSDGHFILGYSQNNGQYFQGTMDDVRVYNRVLSAAEIKQLYSTTGGSQAVNVSQAGPGSLGANSGLAGWWTFDGKDADWSGHTMKDRSGNGNTGTLNSLNQSTVVIGKQGQALKFDGAASYVNVADAANLDPAYVSLSAWVKTTATGDYIIAKDPPGALPPDALSPPPAKPVDDSTIATSTSRKINISKWDGEANLTIAYDGTGDVDIYPLTASSTASSTQNTNGQEFMVILGTKPASNVIPFDLGGTSNLDFLYQGPLWQEKGLFGPTKDCSDTVCDVGVGLSHRPENVVDSYAVYLKGEKSGDYSALGGHNYMAGKAFHIYRPEVWDKNGKTTWANLHIDPVTNVMTITIPQSYLDTAVYPLHVDPTFGYLSIGASTDDSSGNDVLFKADTTPVSNGTLTSISIYAFTTGTTHQTPALYDDSSGQPSNLLAAVNNAGAQNTGAPAWMTTSISYAGLTSGTQYWLGTGQDSPGGDITWQYDTGGGLYFYGLSGADWPGSALGFSSFPEQASVYATYTAAGGGPKTNVPYALDVTATGKAEMMLMSSSQIYAATSTSAVNDGKWHHVVGTYDGSAVKVYVDGSLQDTNSNFSGNLPTDSGPLHIGADYQATAANFFNGSLDDVRVYGRALSASEVKGLYNTGK